MNKDQDKASKDNRSQQCNPNSDKYQGYSSAYSGTGTKADLDSHSQQMNPNHPTYSSSRGGNKKS